MAPKTLSSFLSPFILPYTLTIPTTKILTLHSKPTLILCKYSHPQNTHRKSSVSETQSYPDPLTGISLTRISVVCGVAFVVNRDYSLF
ncbi:hypothetical protein ACFX13_042484 [Malus domestica]